MPLPVPPNPARSPWQRLYAAALAARRRRGRRLAARRGAAGRPVVSVGNLAWGGAGKTPFTIALADHLARSGRRVAVLSRGYGRRGRGARLVSRGAGPMVGVDLAGDEPHLMASRLPGVAVVVGERRIEAARLALAELEPAPDLFVLDDGFSHVALARELELLLFPSADPWAGGRLLPAGRLREPLGAAAAADAVVLTGLAGGADGAPVEPGAGRELARALESYGFRGPGFASATVAGRPRRGDGAPVPEGTACYAVAGIARPEAFFASARAAGVRLVGTRAFPDHHPFTDSDLEAIETAAAGADAELVLVTEKDASRLSGRLAGRLAVLPIAARPEPAFWTWLDARLAEIAS